MKHYLKLLFVFMLFLASSQSAYSEERKYEEEYGIAIANCWGKVTPPTIYNDNWNATIFITLDNGLTITNDSNWKHESQAKQVSSLTFSGKVNLIYSRIYGLTFITDDNVDFSISALYIDKNHNFGNPSRITSMTENVETIQHWFSTETRYGYILELNDGEIWLSEAFSKHEIWEVGDRIINVGNNKFPLLINLDTFIKSKTYLKDEHYLNNLELMN